MSTILQLIGGKTFETGAGSVSKTNADARLKIKPKERMGITAQLAIMNESGVDIASCLESIARQSKKLEIRRMLTQVHTDVMGGRQLSDALKRFPRVFDESFVATIAAGEASGNISGVLQELSKLQRRDIQLRSTIRTVLAYPVLLSSVSLLVIAGLVFFVLPRFTTMFADFDVTLPLITRMLMGFTNELTARYWLWLPLAIASFGGLIAFRFTKQGSRMWDAMILNVVIIKDVTQSLTIGRVCRLLSVMISSGVPLLESLQLTRMAVKNSLYREMLLSMEQDVVNGMGMGDNLSNARFVPPAAAEMLTTAEKNGALPEVTKIIGAHYEEEGEIKLKELVTILEPLIIVVMGVVVSTVIMSIMLPMFDLSSLH